MKPVDSTLELSRLRETSSSELGSALRDLSARGPDASELASLATRLSLQGVAMTPPSAPPTRAPSRAPWKLALTGAAAAGVAAWLLWPPGTTSLPKAASAEAHATTSPVVEVSSNMGAGRRWVPANERTRALPSVPPSAPAADAASDEEPAPTPGGRALETREAQRLQVEKSAVPTSAGAPEAATSEPRFREAPAPRTASKVPSPTGNDGDAPSGTGAAPSELELLRGARLALRSSPSEALRLAEAHRSSYPSGKLTQERELIAISALVAQGHRTAALTRAASFERAFPNSPYRKQIGELLQ